MPLLRWGRANKTIPQGRNQRSPCLGESGIQWKEGTALYPNWNAGNRSVYTAQNSSNHMPDLWSHCSKLYHQTGGRVQCHRTPCIRNLFEKNKLNLARYTVLTSHIFSTANAVHVQVFQPRWESLFQLKHFLKFYNKINRHLTENTHWLRSWGFGDLFPCTHWTQNEWRRLPGPKLLFTKGLVYLASPT